MLKNKVFGCLSLLILLALTNKTLAQCITPSLITSSPAQLCAPGGTTNLNASSSVGSSIAWYTVAVGGSPLGSAPTGSNFNVNAVSTTTFFAEAFTISSNSLTLNYTGNLQVFTASVTGNHTFQTWGGRGGNDGLIGANGGYAAGVLALNAGQTVAINVGGQGGQGSGAGTSGWNGGGAAGPGGSSGGGGGASDVRLGGTALINRVLVAGGGGGAGNGINAGAGGGLTGDGFVGTPASGGSQNAGGTGGNGWGALGQGGSHTGDGGGGGGGYYGGSAGIGDNGGGGGSSYIAGVSNGTTIAGSASMPNPSGGTMNGNAAAGLVRIFYPNIGCVSASRTVVIFTVNPNPIITVNNGTICAGQNFTINPNGANTYTIQGGNPVVSPAANTSYTVAGTSAAGCVSQALAISSLIVNPNPIITVNNGTICVGQNFTINPNGANTYTIQGGNPVVSPPSNAIFTVSGTSGAGCVSQAVAISSLIVNPNPTITVNNGTICAGQNFTINPSGANTYTIQGGNPVVSPPSNAIFTVAGTSTAGCISQAVATSSLIVNANPIITVNSGSICAGQSFTINPNGANTYTIQGGNPVVSPPSNAIFTVAGTSTAGCVSQAVAISSLIVNVNPTITVNNGAICAGQSFTINPNGANTYTIQGANAVVSPSINTTYTVIGTNTLTGCRSQSFATSNLTVNPNPTVSISGASGICTGQNASLTANGAITYTWSTGSTSASIITTPTANTTYTLTGSTPQGCSSFTTQLVTVQLSLSVSIAGPTTICYGQAANLSGLGGVTYTWNIGATSSTIAPTLTTTTTFSVIGASGTCSNTAIKTISVTPNPTVTITGTNAICAGGSSSLTVNGATTYTWSTGSTSASVVFSPSATSVYSVVGSYSTGCLNATTQTVTVYALPVVSISGPSVICLGDSIALVANGANAYVWNNNATTTTIVITPTTTSTYSAVGTDTNGCVGLSEIDSIFVNPLPIISIASTATTICVGEGVTLTANGANTYTWSGGLNTTSISVSPSVSTTYSASGSGTNSCVGRNTLQIIVSECTSINTIASKTAIKVYPNPNNGEFTIELTNINNSNITIINVLGQIIKTQKAELMNQIDLNLFDKGIYFINVMEDNQSVYRGSMIKE